MTRFHAPVPIEGHRHVLITGTAGCSGAARRFGILSGLNNLVAPVKGIDRRGVNGRAVPFQNLGFVLSAENIRIDFLFAPCRIALSGNGHRFARDGDDFAARAAAAFIRKSWSLPSVPFESVGTMRVVLPFQSRSSDFQTQPLDESSPAGIQLELISVGTVERLTCRAGHIR